MSSSAEPSPNRQDELRRRRQQRSTRILGDKTDRLSRIKQTVHEESAVLTPRVSRTPGIRSRGSSRSVSPSAANRQRLTNQPDDQVLTERLKAVLNSIHAEEESAATTTTTATATASASVRPPLPEPETVIPPTAEPELAKVPASPMPTPVPRSRSSSTIAGLITPRIIERNYSGTPNLTSQILIDDFDNDDGDLFSNFVLPSTIPPTPSAFSVMMDDEEPPEFSLAEFLPPEMSAVLEDMGGLPRGFLGYSTYIKEERIRSRRWQILHFTCISLFLVVWFKMFATKLVASPPVPFWLNDVSAIFWTAGKDTCEVPATKTTTRLVFNDQPLFYYFLLTEMFLHSAHFLWDQRWRKEHYPTTQANAENSSFGPAIEYTALAISVFTRYRNIWSNLITDTCVLLFAVWVYLLLF